MVRSPTLLLWLASSFVESSSTRNDVSHGWISALESSLAASKAQGSTIAVTGTLDTCPFCVVVRRHPEPQQNKRQSEEDDVDKFGDLNLIPFLPSPSLFSIDDLGLVTMTGFLPDLRHASRVLMQHVEQQRALYGESRPVRVLKYFAGYLNGIARVDGGRPLGVATILALISANKNGYDLFVVDPAGNWHPYTSVAVIGRYSEEAVGTEVNFKSPRETLNLAMRNLLKAQDRQSDDADKYSGVLMHGEACELSSISTTDIRDSLKLASEKDEVQ